jgi:hypothetical protein
VPPLPRFACLALLILPLLPPGICRAALVGYWPFDSSSSLAQDSSGNGNTLTLQSVSSISSGKRGGAAAFNGTSSYCLANIATLPVGNSPYTIAAWIKPTATGDRGIVGWGNFGQTRKVIALRLLGTNGFRHYWWGADLDATAPVNYSDGQWHHAAAVYDGVTRAIFFDGALIAQDSPGANSAGNSSFRIGSTNSAEFFKGQLDDVAVWNHALSAVEITGLATGGAPVGGPKITSFTATPPSAFEGQQVQLAWVVDTSQITGAFSYELKAGAAVLATGTSATGSYQVIIPDLAGTAQNITYTLRAIETGGAGIANARGVSVAADPGRPVATPQPFLATAGQTPLPIVLTGTDPNGAALSYSIASGPAKGTLTGAPPQVTYTADAGASGTDTFTFRATDGKYDSAPAAVTITINPPPAEPTAIHLDAENVRDSVSAGGFIANLSSDDPNPGEALTFSIVAGDGGADNAFFSISGFQLRAAQPLSGQTGRVLSLRLRVTDAAGFSFEQAFSLTVVPPPVGVVINEIHCNGVDNTIPNEFVELYNRGTAAVSLAGWRLSGGIDYSFPAATSLAPGAYLIVAASPPTILTRFGKSALGPWTGGLNGDGETIRLRDASDAVVDEIDYQIGFPWPVAAGGDGASLEKVNPQLDGSLGGSWRSSVLPAANATTDTATPGAVNLQFRTAVPPAIRQVAHSPQQPTSQQPVLFTAKVTDPDGVATVTLSYQVVSPGNYIPRYLSNIPAANNIATETRSLNPAFETNWISVPMADDGLQRDGQGGDAIWTAILPPFPHRTLLRYRITAADNAGNSIRVPYADDPAANFGCFIYDGVPAYGATTAAALQSLPVYHLLTKASDWTDCMAYDSTKQITQGLTARFYYNWNGTFVYDGVVYDNITYRTRGGNGRYLGAGKRSLRFKFHRGSHLDVRDQQGRRYPRKWQTLTTGKGIENHGTLTFALNEWLSYRLWNANGVPAPFAHFAHWRNITTAAEQPDSYHGDFQGLAFVQEDYDVRFLEAHAMPKGNLYKLLNQTNAPLDQQRYQAPNGAKNGADHSWIENSLTGFTAPDVVAANVNLPAWERYHAIVQAVRHYDYWPNADKNMAYYFEPVYTAQNGNRGKLWILPFDVDASWGPNWNAGEDVVYNALFVSGGGGDTGTNPTLWPDYFNAVREVRDLAFQPDQINPLIDEAAAIVSPVVAADYARWKLAPADVGSYSGISGPGMTSLAALVQDLRNFAFTGGGWPGGSVGAGGRAAFLDTLQASQGEGAKIPATPTLTYTGSPGYPLNDLRFLTSDFADPQGAETFGAIQWRVAEIDDPAAPAFVAGEPKKLEITPAFTVESPAFAAAWRVPGAICRSGHAYRARVRMKDATGRWSHWSAPVQFIASAANVAPYQQSLVLTEIMYHPAEPTETERAQGWSAADFEYLEIRNVTSLPVDLTDVRLTKGVDFDFPANATLAAGASVLVVRNAAAFASRHGAGKPVVGVWQAGDALSDGGEWIKLSFGAGEEITSVTYDDDAPWPTAADGGGSSLVRILPENLLLDPNLPTSWRASSVAGGTPGADDRTTFAAWAAVNGLPGGPADDPDGDGSPSILEFLLGSDPAAPSSRPAVEAAIQPATADTSAFLTLTFSRRDISGLSRCVAQFSQDLTSWTLPSTFVSAQAQPDGTVQEMWRCPVPQTSPATLFGRIQIGWE